MWTSEGVGTLAVGLQSGSLLAQPHGKRVPHLIPEGYNKKGIRVENKDEGTLGPLFHDTLPCPHLSASMEPLGSRAFTALGGGVGMCGEWTPSDALLMGTAP